MQKTHYFTIALQKSLRTFINVLPIIVGMLLLTSLVVTLFPAQLHAGVFGNGEIFDSLLAAAAGSIAVGHPLASYLLGGEMLKVGVSLTAVTALLVTWVTVGIVQIPAEAMILGTRFAAYRNLISFLAAIAISFLTPFTLRMLGAI
ncbi:hypothetical protein [Methylomarinum vadi]|uniref:hypothetical protein n=1 Tax=Methylomarinum vadi TaxID=438855 RepID=UPI0004DF056D|nr:hypothetical protein [Methylomarinum vadi]